MRRHRPRSAVLRLVYVGVAAAVVAVPTRGAPEAPSQVDISNDRLGAAIEVLRSAYRHPAMIRVEGAFYSPKVQPSPNALAMLEQRGPVPRRKLDGVDLVAQNSVVGYLTADGRFRREFFVTSLQFGPAGSGIMFEVGGPQYWAESSGADAEQALLSRNPPRTEVEENEAYLKSSAFYMNAELSPVAVAREFLKRVEIAGDATIVSGAAQGLITVQTQRGGAFVTFDEHTGVIRRFGELQRNGFPPKPLVREYDGIYRDHLFPAPQPARMRTIRDNNPAHLESSWFYFTKIEVFESAQDDLFRWQSLAKKARDKVTGEILLADNSVDEKATTYERQARNRPSIPLYTINEKGEPVAPRSPFTPQRYALIAGGVCLLLALGVFLRRRIG